MKVTAFLPTGCGLALLLLLLLLFNASSGAAESRAPLGGYHWYTMFMFGDSFADTGNLPKTGCRSSLSRQWHYPYGTFNGGRSGNPLGRFSNYLVQPDIIARMLGRLEAPPAYKRTMKHYCDPSGMGFAVGGSGVYPVPENLTTLSQQIDSFEKLIKDGSISKWHLADSVALVAISGNDYDHVNTSDVGSMISLIGNVTTEIIGNVQRLQKLGVKKVLVNKLHPVGCTPWLTRTTNYTACNSRANMGVFLHNGNLEIKLGNTSNVHILDLDTAFSNIVNPAPGEQGSKLAKRFQHKLKPCCESFDPEGYCGQQDKDSQRLYTVCKNPDQYFYWDSVHPTQAGWEAVMKQLQKPMLKFLTQDH